MNRKIPEGAIGAVKSLYYKFGRFGLLYYWSGTGWNRSTKDADTFRREMAGKADKFSMSEGKTSGY